MKNFSIFQETELFIYLLENETPTNPCQNFILQAKEVCYISAYKLFQLKPGKSRFYPLFVSEEVGS